MGRQEPGGICYRRIAYEPLPSQRAFHDSAARFKGFSGPIGSGKSQALCQEAIKLTYLNVGRTGLIGAPTYPMLRDATQATLFEILDHNHIPYDYNKAENVLVMQDTRSRILFRPVDDFERLRGTNLAWFGLDELTYTPEPAWLRLEGRLRDPQATRLCGFAVWTPKGYDWVYQKFIADPVRGYHAVIARPFENRFLLEKIPDFYDQLKKSYDENFYQQEVLGQYLNMHGGLVYTAFQRNDNLADLSLERGLPLLWTLDFNVDPMCSVVVQIVRGVVRVLDEIVLRHASTEEACEAFQQRFPDHPAGVVVYGDASGNHQHTTGTTDYQIVRDFFRGNYHARLVYKVARSNPSVRDRVMLTNSLLRNAGGENRLLIDPKCKELIKDFEQVSYKADSNQIDKDRDRRRTHLADALGYLLWEECGPRPAIGEKGERLL
ncbi:MAG TPA: terminase family protein [Bryobacteraceae bacterium]|nr:terminase family protein [Bryobacteraceae bacterium]